jgi:hypothetical protein
MSLPGSKQRLFLVILEQVNAGLISAVSGGNEE